jgi:hypothetical protein
MTGLGKHPTFLADQASATPPDWSRTQPGWHSPASPALVSRRRGHRVPTFLLRRGDALATITTDGVIETTVVPQVTPWFDWSPTYPLVASLSNGPQNDIHVMNPDGTALVS